jgi:protein-S-isoprenylcysteine O-methyltransferase Ste14
MPTIERSRRGEWIGRLLVALQFVLLAGLAWNAMRATGSWAPGVWLCHAAAAALGVWALRSNPPGNFNIRPTPRSDGRMVSGGPYRWIRHPMYSAVLLFALACAGAGGHWVGWLAAAVLAAVLLGKAILEEGWMQQQHPAYGDYRARTRRFVPGIF